MNTHFTGRVILVCPDCESHLVNVASCGERYHCTDCELTLVRKTDGFDLHRFGEDIGVRSLEQILIQVHWHPDTWVTLRESSAPEQRGPVGCS